MSGSYPTHQQPALTGLRPALTVQPRSGVPRGFRSRDETESWCARLHLDQI